MIEEAARVLSDCHSEACYGHMSGYATTQKILRASCFWPSIFTDCILAIRKCHEFQIYQYKMRAPPTHLHPVITIGHFSKLGIDYMTSNPRLVRGHAYIIVIMDYFTKWAEMTPIYSTDGKTAGQFIFNHVISRFGIPQAIVIYHSPHFRDYMMAELKSALGLHHNGSTPYYLEANGQVEAVNKIPSLKLAVELLPSTSPKEECLLYFDRLDETRHLAALVIEVENKWVTSHFDQSISPRTFFEGDLVLLYEQANDKLGAGKFERMWHGPHIVKHVLQKGAYELIDYEGNPLDKPQNGIYLKKYYS
eukprot:PITA_36331